MIENSSYFVLDYFENIKFNNVFLHSSLIDLISEIGYLCVYMCVCVYSERDSDM